MNALNQVTYNRKSRKAMTKICLAMEELQLTICILNFHLKILPIKLVDTGGRGDRGVYGKSEGSSESSKVS